MKKHDRICQIAHHIAGILKSIHTKGENIHMRQQAQAITIYLTLFIMLLAVDTARSQAPTVPIMRDRGGYSSSLIQEANKARENGALLSMEQVAGQIHRQHFVASLPQPHSIPLHSRAIWERSRAAHVRVGWHYLCNRCDNWHQSLAGGFFINAYGLVATCQHVIDPSSRNYREGYLIAAGDDGTFYPVVEVLASHAPTDVAILRVAVEKTVPFLPLSVHVYPGDDAWCYSYPLRRAGYFSHGIVNRFHYENKDDTEVARLAVTTDWAPGSSGSAIIDTYGNAIGIVSTITPAGTGRPQTRRRQEGDEVHNFISDPTAIIFRTASRAADIIALTEPGKQPQQTPETDNAEEPEIIEKELPPAEPEAPEPIEEKAPEDEKASAPTSDS